MLPTGADESPSLDFSELGTHPILLAYQTLLDAFDSLSQWEDISTDWPVPRIDKQKAIVSIARRMLIVIWHVLTKKEVDPHAIARSMMTWCSSHHLARSKGLHRLEFVRQRLDVLGLLDQGSSFRANGRTHYLAFTS